MITNYDVERVSAHSVICGTQILSQKILEQFFPDKRFIFVIDAQVAPLMRLFDGRCPVITKTGGDNLKTFEGLQDLIQEILPHVDRHTVMVVMGGGSLGDAAGFAASMLMRGLTWVFIPTTTLSMIDSSIGGKTSINTSHGKNLVGAIHPPHLTISDMSVLKTLPIRDQKSGLAEAIKMSIIKDSPLFHYIQQHDVLTELGSIQHVVERSVALKLNIINGDWFERLSNSQRKWLNLGHTTAHALETATGHSALLKHGEAVAIGLSVKAYMSEEMGFIAKSEARQIIDLLKKYDLHTTLRDILDSEEKQIKFFNAMTYDKKNDGSDVTFTLTKGIGMGCTHVQMPLPQVRDMFIKMSHLLG